jgi:hypothetical protein
MGGVYFDSSGQGYVWRFPFPDNIQSQLVLKTNLSGRITNSDLEQAGLLAQVSVTSHHHDAAYATIANGSDNTPAVACITKEAVTSDGPAAHLCNYTCTHQHQHRYCHMPHFLSGDANVMAGDASHLQHLTHSAFLSISNRNICSPNHGNPLLGLPRESALQLISALCLVLPPQPQPQSNETPPTKSLASGLTSALAKASPAPSMPSCFPKTSFATSWCSTLIHRYNYKG